MLQVGAFWLSDKEGPTRVRVVRANAICSSTLTPLGPIKTNQPQKCRDEILKHLVGVLLILLVIFGVPQQMPTILGLVTAGLTGKDYPDRLPAVRSALCGIDRRNQRFQPSKLSL